MARYLKIKLLVTYSVTMSAALPILDVFTGKQAGNIFCLNNQTNIACFMIITSNLSIISPKIEIINICK